MNFKKPRSSRRMWPLNKNKFEKSWLIYMVAPLTLLVSFFACEKKKTPEESQNKSAQSNAIQALAKSVEEALELFSRSLETSKARLGGLLVLAKTNDLNWAQSVHAAQVEVSENNVKLLLSQKFTNLPGSAAVLKEEGSLKEIVSNSIEEAEKAQKDYLKDALLFTDAVEYVPYRGWAFRKPETANAGEAEKIQKLWSAKTLSYVYVDGVLYLTPHKILPDVSLFNGEKTAAKELSAKQDLFTFAAFARKKALEIAGEEMQKWPRFIENASDKNNQIRTRAIRLADAGELAIVKKDEYGMVKFSNGMAGRAWVPKLDDAEASVGGIRTRPNLQAYLDSVAPKLSAN